MGKRATGKRGSRLSTGALVPTPRIERCILEIRGERVILDADLARLYGVTTKRLNEQVKNEFHASWLYMAMAFALEDMNLKGFANWFYAQADEEREHAMKIANYIMDQGGQVTLTELPKPKTEYKSVEEIVKGALDHELKVTKQINEIAMMAEKESDLATRQFMAWFIDEQVEEVSSVTNLLEMVKMAQTPGQLLMLQGHLKRD